MDMHVNNLNTNVVAGLTTDYSHQYFHGNQQQEGMGQLQQPTTLQMLYQPPSVVPIYAIPVTMYNSDSVHPHYQTEELEQSNPIAYQSALPLMLSTSAIPLELDCNDQYSMQHQYYSHQYVGGEACQMGLSMTHFASWHVAEASFAPSSLTEIINSFARRDLVAMGESEQASSERQQGAVAENQMADLQPPRAASHANELFCNFCAKSRRHRAKSMSHKLRDVNGTITCTTLLNHLCPICKEKGHTAKYCSKSAN